MLWSFSGINPVETAGFSENDITFLRTSLPDQPAFSFFTLFSLPNLAPLFYNSPCFLISWNGTFHLCTIVVSSGTYSNFSLVGYSLGYSRTIRTNAPTKLRTIVDSSSI
jgi:hypothetical protein